MDRCNCKSFITLTTVIVALSFWNFVEGETSAARRGVGVGFGLHKTTPSSIEGHISSSTATNNKNNQTTATSTETGTPTTKKTSKMNDGEKIEQHIQTQQQDEGGVKDLTAIVIGAGPSGLATSLSLSNVCKKVHLVEKHPTFEKRGATFG